MARENPFKKLGLPESPVILAPLAGLTDVPFRRTCSGAGADLTYVEMLSATALLYESPKTYRMLTRHPSERIVGAQVSSKTPEDLGRAIEILHKLPFETIDINMGCPVAKVVRNGGGSAILREPEKVFQAVTLARAATDKPLSVKIRIGWDKQTVTGLEVADAIEKAGADWMTVHGRLRCEDYDAPVKLDIVADIKRRASIPVIGNGNVFSIGDWQHMREKTDVDGVMISRGCLGNPWIFGELKGRGNQLSVDEWLKVIDDHLRWQGETYGFEGMGAVCMRKHLLWYVKGFPGAKKIREKIVEVGAIDEAARLVATYAANLKEKGITHRSGISHLGVETRFAFDPKYDMDRRLDRGVGHDMMDENPLE